MKGPRPDGGATMNARRDARRHAALSAEAMGVLREYAAAVWGDPAHLAEVDPGEREALFEIADAIDTPGASAAYLRELADLCRSGHGHWTEYCELREGQCQTPAMRET